MFTRRLYLLLMLALVLPLLALGFVLVFSGSERTGYILVTAGFVIQFAILLAQSNRSDRE